MIRSSDDATRLARLVLGVPVFAAQEVVDIRPEVDELVCLEALPLFKAEQEGRELPSSGAIVELAGMRRRQRAYRHRVAEASPSRTGTRTTSWAS